MVSEAKARSLSFEAYTGDPLARLALRTLQWQSWQLPVLYTVAWVVLSGLSILVYILRDGSFDISRFGGYQSAIPGEAVNWIMFLFASRLYVYFSQTSGALYEGLADNGVIKRSECKTLVRGGAKSIRRLHRNVFWLLGAVTFSMILCTVWYYQYALDPSRNEMIKYRSTMSFMYMPHLAFGAYMIGMIVARVVSTLYGLRKVFKTAKVSVQPLHPDMCGGLRHLHSYAMATAYLMALFGLVFVVLSYTLSRVLVDGTITTHATEILSYPFFWVGAALYVTLTPALFFGILWTAHGPMERAKAKVLKKLSSAFDKQHEDIMKTLDGDISSLEAKFKLLDSVDQLYRKTAAFPVWPLDTRSLRWFGAVFGSPAVIFVATILSQKYFLE